MSKDALDYDVIVERVIEGAIEEMKPAFRRDAEGRFNGAIDEAVRGVVDEKCRERIGEIVEAHLNEPRQATNSYGEPRGEPKSLGEWMADELRSYMEQKVRPSDGRVCDYNRSENTETRWHYFVRTIAKEEIEAVVKPLARQAAAAAAEQIQKVAVDTLREQLGRAIAGLRT